MVLSRRDCHRSRAVAQTEKGDLESLEAFFDDHGVARGAELSIAHRIEDRAFRRRAILRDDDALAGGEAVSLDHHRDAEFTAAHDRERVVERFARAKARRRHEVTRHERLREGFARLEPRGGGGRAEEQPSFLLKPIGNAAAQGHLGADDSEINLLAICKRVDGV